MIVWVLTTCHTQYTSDSSICVFYLIEKHSKFLLHTLEVIYMCTLCDSTGLFEMIVGVLTTCHTQYTWDSSVCIFLFNRTTLQGFVTYLTSSLCAPFVILQGYSKWLSGFEQLVIHNILVRGVYVLFYLIEQHSKFLLHILQVLYMCTICDSTGLFEMIVGVLTTCHTQCTWDRCICVFI